MTQGSPFLKRGPDTHGMMVGMLICLSIIAVHFTVRYDGDFFLRFLFLLLLGGMIDVVYALLKDGRPVYPQASTLVTTALLVLSLPARMPEWEVFTGILVAVVLGKRMVDSSALRLNPMLLGRLFLMVVFADSIQTWLPPDARIDVLTSATPLGLHAAEGASYSPFKLWLGEIGGDWEGVVAVLPGSPGEVMPILSLILGVGLYLYGVLDWRAGTTFVAGFCLTALALQMPLNFHLAAGSIFFTAVFIISDPRSTPGSKAGRLAAGLLAGVLNAIIRNHGYYPEGVALSVLAVNLLSPTLDRLAFHARGFKLRRRIQAKR